MRARSVHPAQRFSLLWVWGVLLPSCSVPPQGHSAHGSQCSSRAVGSHICCPQLQPEMTSCFCQHLNKILLKKKGGAGGGEDPIAFFARWAFLSLGAISEADGSDRAWPERERKTMTYCPSLLLFSVIKGRVLFPVWGFETFESHPNLFPCSQNRSFVVCGKNHSPAQSSLLLAEHAWDRDGKFHHVSIVHAGLRAAGCRKSQDPSGE